MSSVSSTAGKLEASWKEWKSQNSKESNKMSQQSTVEVAPDRPKTPMAEDAMDFGGTSPKGDGQDDVDSGSIGSHVNVIINKMPVPPYGSNPFGKQKLPRYFSGFVGPGWKPPTKKGVKKRPADILTNGENMNVFKAIILNMLSQSHPVSPACNYMQDKPLYTFARSKHKKQAIKKLKVTHNKPAIAVVNEILPNLEFVCTTDGPPHNPNFTVTVLYPPENGKEFVGSGRSKKIAKNTVAEKILQTLGVELPPVEMNVDKGEDAKGMDPRMDVNVNTGMFSANPYHHLFQSQLDFSSDDILGTDFDCNTEMSQPMIDFGRIRRLKNIQNFEENSCLALNALLSPQTINFVTLSEEGPPHSKIFTVQCTFQDKTFIGKGVSKRKAKASAAKQALISILGTKFYHSFAGGSVLFSNSIESVITPSKLSNERFDNSAEPNEYDLAFSDHVSKLVTSKFEELLKDNEAHMAQKVLAGVVMTTGSPLIETASVVAVTTGTKCIEGDFMSESGLALNDCHAEILATRCVRDFLYSQLDNFLSLNEENEFNIFEYDPNSQGEKTIILKEGVKFHLYISTSPCGDARIFSPKGTEASPADDIEDSHPNRVNRGVLRAKIEAGEGTIPVANLSSGPQTWDAIIQGNALHTMSCSDKVCRWNVIGFQGALLSSLISPVYYSSITLGSLHHPVHFKRAIIGRIEPLINEVSPPFFVNQPLLLMVTCEQKRKVKKSPNHAIAWAHGWSTYEHISASKGRCEPGGVASRLTKRMAFLRFLKLYRNQSGKRDNFVQLSYGDAKSLAEKYQITKRKFKEHMVESKFGHWISKPIEQDSFIITK